MGNILAIDDDREILKIIKRALESQKHQVFCHEQAEGISKEELLRCDLLLLDIMMPKMDGYQFCENIRDMVDCPIVFITAKNEEADIIKGLHIGADDYIQKPFSIGELRARVEAHLRREHRVRQNSFLVSGVRFVIQSKEVYVNSNQIHLTKSEYSICEFLAFNHGQTFSREQIYEAVFGFDKDTYDNVIVEHIKNIRNKFSSYQLLPIDTVWGIGYRWIE